MNTIDTYEHDRAVTAFFDTHAAAEKAKANVIAAGIPASNVSLVEGNSHTTTADRTVGSSQQTEGFWGSLKNLFAPEEDKHAYAEGLSRGGFLLTVHTDETHYDRVVDILDDEGAVDMNEREAQWKSEGWSGRHDTAPLVGSAATAGATRTETSSAAALGTATPSAAAYENTTSRETGLSAGGAAAGTALGARGAGVGGETMQLVEETLRVGKRDVNHGRVRLRSYVVEKPVHESVNLHSETVDVVRRPVSRTLNPGEELFQERTISAEGHHEEAVVSKEARVYEEIGLTKTAQDSTREINDTVRRQEVEVNDERTAGGRGVVGERGLVGGSAMRGLGNEITEHMDVLDSTGAKVGSVDHYDGGDTIKLAKHDAPDGKHHLIPMSWVARVDQHVHLAKTASEAMAGWTAA